MHCSIRSRIVLGSICGMLLIALTVSVGLNLEWVRGFDGAIQSAVFSLRTETITPIIETTTEWSGIGISHLLMLAFLIFLLACKTVRKAIIYFVSFMAADTVFNILKTAMDRPRPSGMNLMDFPLDSSYPSGHVFMACAFACFTIYVIIQEYPGIPRPAKIALVAFAVIWPLYIGFTRIYVGVHWPTDVLGSLLFGAGTFLPFATVIWQKLANKPKKTKGKGVKTVSKEGCDD